MDDDARLGQLSRKLMPGPWADSAQSSISPGPGRAMKN
jgi:hypothetical protein